MSDIFNFEFTPGMYQLSTAVPNPGQDKRRKGKWPYGAMIPAGVYQVTSDETIIDPNVPDLTVEIFSKVGKAIMRNLTPLEMSPYQSWRYEQELSDSDLAEILGHLVKNGHVALDEVQDVWEDLCDEYEQSSIEVLSDDDDDDDEEEDDDEDSIDHPSMIMSDDDDEECYVPPEVANG